MVEHSQINTREMIPEPEGHSGLLPKSVFERDLCFHALEPGKNCVNWPIPEVPSNLLSHCPQMKLVAFCRTLISLAIITSLAIIFKLCSFACNIVSLETPWFLLLIITVNHF